MDTEKYDNDKEVQEYSGNISPEFIAKALKMYQRYSSDKAQLHQRIKENNRWYKSNYGKMINPHTNETEPATAFIFSAIENKYADAIDNYPTANFLEREPSDTQTAKMLTKIIPAELEMTGFKKVYKDNWRRKLKHGTAVYGVFCDEMNEEIDIKAIDIMNVYCDMYVTDVQQSQFLFIKTAVDNSILRDNYPKFSALFKGDANVETYSGTHQIDDRTEIIDCYYKKTDGTMHMMKFVGSTVIDATEDTPGYENGLYSHGMYPVIFDVLYPEEDSPFGFGIVDIIRNPQQYIDKLDAIIIKNAILSGKQRFLVKENGNVNEKEFTDYSRDIVHCTGNVDETNVKPLQANSLSNYVLEHRNEKINELKEVIGNRDFQQGGTTGSVTAATAITTLQQAGQKLSRTIIDDSYDVFKSLIYMVIELMREFYTENKIYRITNEVGETEFTEFNNSMLINEKPLRDSFGFVIDTEYKRAEFDIDVIPQRENPFSKESNNQTMLSLWTSGFFLPQNFDVSLIVLQNMNFDGKEKIIQQIRELQRKQQIEQLEQLRQMQQEQSTGGDGLIEVGSVGEEDDNLIEVGNIGGGM